MELRFSPNVPFELQEGIRRELRGIHEDGIICYIEYSRRTGTTVGFQYGKDYIFYTEVELKGLNFRDVAISTVKRLLDMNREKPIEAMNDKEVVDRYVSMRLEALDMDETKRKTVEERLNAGLIKGLEFMKGQV